MTFIAPPKPRPLPALAFVLLMVLTALPGSSTPASANQATGLSAPATPAGDSLAWALSTINNGAVSLDAVEIQRRFAPVFLSGLPADQLIAVFQTYLVANAPMRIARFEGPIDGSRLKAILATGGGDWRVTIGVQPADELIDELFFEPVFLPAPPAKVPASWRGLDRLLAKVAPGVSFMAADVTGGTCQPIHGYHDDNSLAIGSNFKLYVLGTLARQIADGIVNWNETLAISDDYRSLPSGDLFRAPAGTGFPVRYYAEQMISVSDNTATDHLIGLLGREQVEAMMAVMGHHDPSLNTPLLLTREWFAIKLRFTDRQVRDYLAADPERRRTMLATEADPAAATLTEADDWPGPYLIDSIEWFASASDLCRAVAYLHQQAQQPGLHEIEDALSIEPGLPIDSGDWAYVGYKGGYETGVKSDTWLLQRRDGRWFALTAIINDPHQEIDGFTLSSLEVAAVNLLAARG